jgi:type II secretion system protein G
MKRNSKGFTLIELLIVVAIIGIIVAIAIPNLLNAIQRAKQRRTMGDIRSTATAVEAYAVDFNRYPPAAAIAFPSSELTYGADTTLGTLSPYISPTYIRVTPLADGWNSWFFYGSDDNGQAYFLASAGRDGTPEINAESDGPTTDFNSDIIYVNGQFVQYPEGVQR